MGLIFLFLNLINAFIYYFFYFLFFVENREERVWFGFISAFDLMLTKNCRIRVRKLA